MRGGSAAAAGGELSLGLAADGDLRWAAVDVGAVLEVARRRLDLSPLAAVVLGDALAGAALLLRFTSKEPGKLVFEARGDGPIGKVVAEAHGDGRLRGLVGEPRLETPEDGELAVGVALGEGLLRVVSEGGARGRYESQVVLSAGSLGNALVHYLEQSQQIHSAALLGVMPRPSGIAAAGGVLIEALPGAREETLAGLEARIADLGGVSRHLEAGGVGMLLDAVLGADEREELERHPLTFGCGCTEDKLRDRLATMSADDLERVFDAEGRAVVECAFCGSRYVVSQADLAVD